MTEWQCVKNKALNSHWIYTHRRSLLFLLFSLAAAGFLAAFQLPVSLFPNVEFPRVVVNLDAGEMTANQMALQVTSPVEQAVRQVPGVRDVRSTTSRGSADISINFDWGINTTLASLQINSAISSILPQLPGKILLHVRAMDPTEFPILSYSLTSPIQTLAQLRDIAAYQILPLLSTVNGVAQVGITGGETPEYRVLIDPLRLHAFHINLNDVVNALNAANTLSAVGKLEKDYQLYLVVVDNPFQNLKQIQQTIIKADPQGLIRLSDIAAVTLSTTSQWIKVKADGQNAVLINVYQQPGSNSVALANAVKEKLKVFSQTIPHGVNISNWYDQSELVVQSAGSVRDAIFIGILLAALVLFVFLRHTKVTLIGIVIVPAVLASTIILLYALNMGFNIMTLGGMAAAVGLIIDDAIVMLEHIIHRLHSNAQDKENEKSVLKAAAEFFKPLIGSSAATLVIFIPLTFLTGVTGAFFKALSITMASSLLISFLMTWLAVPLMAEYLLTEKDYHQKEMGKVMLGLQRRYHQVMMRCLRRPARSVVIIILPLLVLGVIASKQVGSGFMPSMDEGGFILDYRSAPGTSLTETNRLLEQVDAIIKLNPNVQTYSRRTGTQLGGGVTEANEGDFFIKLKPFPRQPINQVMDDIRAQVTQKVPGLDIDLAQLMEDLIGDLTAVPQPVEIKIFSTDALQLPALADKVAAALVKIPGVVDVNNGINPAGSALNIDIDPLKAAGEGMTPDQITQSLTLYLSGTVATQLILGTKSVDVRVMLPPVDYNSEEKLKALLLTAPDGHVFPLHRVAVIKSIDGQPQINHENLKPMVAVTARISGRDLGSVMIDVKQMMSTSHLLPPGVYYELGGLYQQQQIAFHGLLMVIIAAFALVFLLLLFLYEDFRVATAVIVIPLLSMCGVFLGLFLTKTELNISSMMGMTMVVGIVTEVAIFYFSEYQNLVETRDPLTALIEAGQNRMRPIIMTTLAAILTLLPLALAIGAGSEMQQPLAIAIISGLIMQVPLTLLVMPVFFHSINKKRD
jgi:CzcA family heavy metal efflux pump